MQGIHSTQCAISLAPPHHLSLLNSTSLSSCTLSSPLRVSPYIPWTFLTWFPLWLPRRSSGSNATPQPHAPSAPTHSYFSPFLFSSRNWITMAPVFGHSSVPKVLMWVPIPASVSPLIPSTHNLREARQRKSPCCTLTLPLFLSFYLPFFRCSPIQCTQLEPTALSLPMSAELPSGVVTQSFSLLLGDTHPVACMA